MVSLTPQAMVGYSSSSDGGAECGTEAVDSETEGKAGLDEAGQRGKCAPTGNLVITLTTGF